MKRIVFALIAALAVTVLAGSLARAGEKPIEEKDVPKPALEAVKKKYPKAKLVGFAREEEDAKVTYEVQIRLETKDKAGKEKTRAIDIDVSAEGKILAEEEVIAKEDLPEKVAKALAASKYGTWKVKRVERVVKEEKDDDASYELVVVNGDSKSEVVFDKDGKITKEEAKKAKKAKKEEKDEDD